MYIELSKSNRVHLEIFFGVLGGSFFFLFIIYHIAKKYISGGFFDDGDDQFPPLDRPSKKESELEEGRYEPFENEHSFVEDITCEDAEAYEGNEEVDEEYVDIDMQEGLLAEVEEQLVAEDAASTQGLSVENHHSKTPPSSSKNISKGKALNQIQRQGFRDPFASHATINVTIERQVSLQRIVGTVHFIKGLSTTANSPEVVRFHVKVLPECKPKGKTKWKHPNAKSFELDFVLSPLKEHDDGDERFICMRLYGRKRSTGVPRLKCYGECSVPWSQIMEQPFEGDLRFLPRARNVSFKRSTLDLTQRLRRKSVGRSIKELNC